MLPILKYIKITKNTMDTFSLNFIEAIASSLVFFILFSSFFCFVSVAKDAPYPASAIFFIISFELSLSSLYSTCMEFVKRFTETFSTPSSLPTTLSTLAEQAAQLIPVILYFSFAIFLLSTSPPRGISIIHPLPILCQLKIYIFLSKITL